MSGRIPTDQHICFGRFRLIPSQRLLLEDENPVNVGGRALALLVVLIERAGDVVPRETLISLVWPDTLVEDAALRVHLAALRKALGDGRNGERYIVTVQQRGYSFVAPIGITDENLPPKPILPPADHNLPKCPSDIVGRDEAIGTIALSVARHRCVAIVGPGGIGKTTVGLAVAERIWMSYPDGTHFVDLASLSEASLVPQALAAVLGVAITSDNPMEGLITALRNRRMLIILDNCEHVVEEAALLAEALLLAVPGINIIATSRETLRIRGEWVHRLDSLWTPDGNAASTMIAREAMEWPAVKLFTTRCAAALGGFDLNDAAVPVVARICRRLDGIPLAIELAAGRVEQFGVTGLAEMLDDRLRLLVRGRRGAPPRHRTLRTTLDWSYDLLSEEEQFVLRRISIFKGSFPARSADAICSVNTVDLLGALASKSLLTINVTDVVVHYRLLETTRDYATEKLRDSGEFDVVARLHAELCRHLAEQIRTDRNAPAANQWMLYAHRLDEIRTGLDRGNATQGDGELSVQLAVASGTLFWRLAGYSLHDRHRH